VATGIPHTRAKKERGGTKFSRSPEGRQRGPAFGKPKENCKKEGGEQTKKIAGGEQEGGSRSEERFPAKYLRGGSCALAITARDTPKNLNQTGNRGVGGGRGGGVSARVAT